MDLFGNAADGTTNLLPYDGEVSYFGQLFPGETANQYYEKLLNSIDWKNDEATIYGKHIITKRRTGWYGDRDFEYRYSGHTKKALPWTDELLELKKLATERTGETFNSCLLNLYHNGEEGMSWHSDNEKELKKNGAIASFSFGAARKFVFKHKQTAQKVAVVLEHGSLLVMKGTIQTHWLHSLPVTKTILRPRINLTFRTITG